ncbi:MAG TPA: helix-turn-helix transcriptional regulator [Phycisphaerae bacterium]|nr:helix-turn-helix transcriptional regulator [Phycisphaerae bacterium]
MNGQPDFASLVRELRDRLGLSQEKFAAKLGVSFPSVNRWENGKAKPSPLAVQQIKDLLRGMGKNGTGLLRKYFPNDEQE